METLYPLFVIILLFALAIIIDQVRRLKNKLIQHDKYLDDLYHHRDETTNELDAQNNAITDIEEKLK